MTNPSTPVPAPVLPTSPASNWIGSAALGLAFGGSQIARAGDELRYTVIPLPIQPAQEITMQARADAVSATYTGWLQSAVDLYRLSVERNGFMTGVLDTMAHGLLGLPLTWLGGTPEMRSALLDADGTPGDFARMHPENECAKIFRDGLGLGFGLGQYVLMCWRCDSVEWDVITARARVATGAEDVDDELLTEQRRVLARAVDRPSGPAPSDLHTLLTDLGEALRSGAIDRVRLARIDDELSAIPKARAAETKTERCRCCGADRVDRPIGQRRLFQLRWRDARWLWRNPVTLQWYYTGRQGMVAVNPGDGEWFLFRTVPDQDIWTHGPWALGTEAAIFVRDSTYDRQNTSAVCAPTHVFSAKGSTDPKTRLDVDAQADNLRWANKLTLPGEWEHRIDAAKAEFIDVTAAIVTWGSDQWEVALTGNRMGQSSGTGFANMDVYMRSTRERRAYYASGWIRQIRAQGLVWWGMDNFGTRNVPVGNYDVRSPEDKLAESKALEAEGGALKSLREGFDAVGYELDPAWIEERAQTKGVRVRAKPSAFDGDLDPKHLPALVLGKEGRQRYGLPPFGDARDNETVMRLFNSGPAGGLPDPSAAPATPVPGTPPAVAPPPPVQPGGSSAAPPAPRLEDGDDLDDVDVDDLDEDEIRAKLADDMNTHGLATCRHGRTNICRTCGVRGTYSVVPGADGGQHGWRVAWRALKRPGPRRAARLGVAPAQLSFEDAEAQLEAALKVLEDLGVYETDDLARAEQERGPDGKFISSGGPKPKTHDSAGRPIVLGPGTKDGLGRSKAAGEARIRTAAAKAATSAAKAGGSHADAAKAHADAAAQHREAAARSVRPDYKAAHEAAAKAHDDLARTHAAAQTVPAAKVTIAPGLPPDCATKMAAAIKDAESLAILKAHPLKELSIGSTITYSGQKAGEKAYGLCLSDGRIEIDHDLHSVYASGPGLSNWQPASHTGVKPWSTTTVAGSADEKRSMTYAHEVAHHIHNQGSSTTSKISRDAWKQMNASAHGAVTRYAETNHQEYFAESFALYSHSPMKLKAADPIGYKMVRDVLRATK